MRAAPVDLLGDQEAAAFGGYGGSVSRGSPPDGLCPSSLTVTLTRLPVPAMETTMPVVARVATGIGDREVVVLSGT